ncbi:MAG: glycosyltransferase [Candidatus Eremiobacteraeota bacterium]|nr:glycosyltransferase [Candidatus Eremiobacteraeota bacterium]
MESSFAALPPLHPACRISVAIPACDEADSIEKTIAAFGRQHAIDGSLLPPGLFEVIVFANGCSDRTASLARAAARCRPGIHVVEAFSGARSNNVGLARKLVMDRAAARLIEAGLGGGIVASTDADTVVDDDWIAWLERESRDVEAVAGHVLISDDEQAAMLAPVRLLYARELAFRRWIADVETLLDPRPEDPAPRHASFVGASFGVRAETYRAAGGMLPLPRLEDLAFSQALQRIDARIRHSVAMRATTSARVRPRVEGGFGTFIADIVERGRRRDTFLVEPAEFWIDTFAGRAALRRYWNGAQTELDGEIISASFGLPAAEWRPLVDRSEWFGTVLERVAARAAQTRPGYAPVPVEDAIAALRALATSRNAATPTRTSAASGAG